MDIFGLFQASQQPEPQQNQAELDHYFAQFEDEPPIKIEDDDEDIFDEDDFTLEDFEANNQALNSFGFTPYPTDDDDFDFDDFLSDDWGARR